MEAGLCEPRLATQDTNSHAQLLERLYGLTEDQSFHSLGATPGPSFHDDRDSSIEYAQPARIFDSSMDGSEKGRDDSLDDAHAGGPLQKRVDDVDWGALDFDFSKGDKKSESTDEAAVDLSQSIASPEDVPISSPRKKQAAGFPTLVDISEIPEIPAFDTFLPTLEENLQRSESVGAPSTAFDLQQESAASSPGEAIIGHTALPQPIRKSESEPTLITTDEVVGNDVPTALKTFALPPGLGKLKAEDTMRRSEWLAQDGFLVPSGRRSMELNTRLARVESHQHEKAYHKAEKERMQARRAELKTLRKARDEKQSEVHRQRSRSLSPELPKQKKDPVKKADFAKQILSRKSIEIVRGKITPLAAKAQSFNKNRPKITIRETKELDGNTSQRMFLAVVIGILSGFSVQFVSFLSTQILFNPKMAQTGEYLQRQAFVTSYLFHAFTSIVLAMTSSYLILYVCPQAGGSGIPEVKTYLSGALYKAHMDQPKTLGVKLISLSLMVASGMPAARDLVHVGCIIASNVCRYWTILEHRWKFKSNLFAGSDRARFEFMSAGVAAAIGGSFLCPVSGVLFAMEEFSTHWTVETTGLCTVAAATASVTSWYFTGSKQGKVNYEDTSGTIDLTMIVLSPAGHATDYRPMLRLWEVPFIVVIGILGGCFGSLFVVVNGFGLARWRKKNMGGPKMKYKKLTEVALVAAFCSLVAVVLPLFWGCRKLSELEKDAVDKARYVNWGYNSCPPDEINEMAALSMNMQGTAMNNLFAETGDMNFSILTLLVYGFAYFLVTVLTVGTATPAGAFIPMVLVGAAVGRCVGVLVRIFLLPSVDVRFYAIMGGAATFSGFMRMPISMTALFMEIAGNTLMTGPLLLCNVIAHIVGGRISPSNTNFVCKFNDYPLLKEDPPQSFGYYTAFDIMTELDKGVQYQPIVIGLKDPVRFAVAILKKTTHSSFPVVVEHRPTSEKRTRDMTLMGLISRADLQQLVNDAICADVDGSTPLDIQSAMGLNPRYVDKDMVAERVYTWFIKMKLRQLVVVDSGCMDVIGVITRHDIHECVLRWYIPWKILQPQASSFMGHSQEPSYDVFRAKE